MQNLIKIYVAKLLADPKMGVDKVPAKLREQVKLALELEKNAK